MGGIPFDQTNPQQPPVPMGDPGQAGGAAPPSGDLASLFGGGGAPGGAPAGFDLGALAGGGDQGAMGGAPPLPGMDAGGGAPGGLNTDQLTGQDLSAMAGSDFSSPEDQMGDEMQAALLDPNTTPEQRDLIQQQIAMAARRRLAGVGGGGLGGQ